MAIVMKFGGSSLANGQLVKDAAEIVLQAIMYRPVVVVSALSGVTDELISLAELPLTRSCQAEFLQSADALLFRHVDYLNQTTDGGPVSAAEAAVRSDFMRRMDRLRQEIFSLCEDGVLPEVRRDLLLSFGERLSAVLLSAVLRCGGLEAVAVDARDFLFTDGRHGQATADLVRTGPAAREILGILVDHNVVPVVTGYIGQAPDGTTTTLGRGGSDYTATVLGAVLEATEVCLWKTEPGIMTADPRMVPEARLVKRLTYWEAAELAYGGAKVLHPMSLQPIMELDIPLSVRDMRRPDLPGTRISGLADRPEGFVQAVTAIDGLSMVTVEGFGMGGVVGLAAEVFAAARSAGVSVRMITQASSETNICLVCRSDEAERLRSAVESGLAGQMSERIVDSVSVDPGLAAVAVVGEGMRGESGVAGRVFSAVAGAGVSVIAIAQGSSERNISFVVRSADVCPAVRAVHSAFKLEKE